VARRRRARSVIHSHRRRGVQWANRNEPDRRGARRSKWICAARGDASRSFADTLKTTSLAASGSSVLTSPSVVDHDDKVTRSREGIMSHVGRHFDLTIGGRPLRIVVVGQESGWPKGPVKRNLGRLVSLDARHHAVYEISGQARRYYAEPGHSGRNPHMRGTTSALRLIFGKGLGTRFEDEFVIPDNGRPFHIFDGFALVNRLLCSVGPKGSSEGHPTRIMFNACLDHFEATMRILEPTLVIVQGSRVERRTLEVFERRRSFSENLHDARFEGRRVLLCTFTHPSARGALRWGEGLDSPYLTSVVVPTLEEAVRRL
jgi:hypothetical protein